MQIEYIIERINDLTTRIIALTKKLDSLVATVSELAEELL